MAEKSFKLLAIVAVDPVRRIRCQQPHCGHSVYAKIHVVEEAGILFVLGSDCFAKRYGEGHPKEFHGYGFGGGRVLTEAEREMLLTNTAALLAQFEAERIEERALAEAKLTAIRERLAEQSENNRLTELHRQDNWQQSRIDSEPELSQAVALPMWTSLKKPNSSFFAYGMGEGQYWVLMQSAIHSGCFIAPAPMPFESRDESLPPPIGVVDIEREVYSSDRDIDELLNWFASRCTAGSRIDSSAEAIQNFANGL